MVFNCNEVLLKNRQAPMTINESEKKEHSAETVAQKLIEIELVGFHLGKVVEDLAMWLVKLAHLRRITHHPRVTISSRFSSRLQTIVQAASSVGSSFSSGLDSP